MDWFNNIKVLPDLNANGQLTLGENIADYGGLQVAYQALQKAMAENPLGNDANGFTPAQRFFLAYANVWAGNQREEFIRLVTKSDPHSLGRWRVNGTLPHISAWYDAFGVKEGDALYLPEEKRASHPARFALVEIENIFDEGLEFEPIHRIFYSIGKDGFMKALSEAAPEFKTETIQKEEIHSKVNEGKGLFVLYDGNEYTLVTLFNTEKELSAWTVQAVIDSLLERKACTVDYIHGMEETLSLAGNGNVALILPDIPKDSFFSSIMSDKAFPRKTFSIGHADEKRYYMEARRIR